jgi:eukaryotic-like serine/threonine-protein kinase
MTRDASLDETVEVASSRSAAADDGVSGPGNADHRQAAPIGLVEVDPALYASHRELARGGMGRIIAARDRRLGRVVAIKELIDDGQGARSSLEREARFEREALITARLQHPAIVNLLEAGRWPTGKPFYTMKLVAGRSLAEVVRQSRPLDERLAFLPHLIAMSEAVAHAHRQRIIHRDLKPSNVLVGDLGETVVIDWGLAKDLAARPGDRTYLPSGPGPLSEPSGSPHVPVSGIDATLDASGAVAEPHEAPARPVTGDAPGAGFDSLTVAGSIMGTPGYMPPEQALGLDVDERADVYALGAILYHVLSGTAPYRGRSVEEILAASLAGPPRPIREVEPGLAQDLVTIVEKAMAREPGARYPRALELAEELRRFQTGQLVAAHRYSRRQLIWRFLARHRAAALASALALIAIAAIGLASLRSVIAERDRAELASAESRRQLAQSHLEQGRQLLLAGDAARALPYLVSARELGIDGAGLRMLFAQARQRLWLVSIDTPIPAHSGIGFRIAGPVAAAHFSSDGALVVGAADTHSAQVWSAETGEPISPPLDHDGRITMARFSPDDRLVVTTSLDGTARIWEARSGQVLVPPLQHDAEVGGAIFSDDGSRVVTASDRMVRIWDTATGAPVLEPFEHDGLVEWVAFVPRRSRILTMTSTTAWLWDAVTGELLQPSPSPDASDIYRTVLYSEDGSRFLLGDRDGTGQLFDRASGRTLGLKIPKLLPGFGSGVNRAALSPDGALVVTTYWGGEGGWSQPADPERPRSSIARVWSAEYGKRTVSLEHAGTINTAEFSPDSKRVITTSRDRTARVWDVSSGEALSGPLRHDDSVVHAEFSPDGRRVITVGHDNAVRIWDATTGGPLATPLPARAHEANVRLSADGSHAFLRGEGRQGWIWSASTGTLRPVESAVGDYDVMFKLSPDGNRVAVGDLDSLQVWDGRSGTTSAVMTHPSATEHELSRDGARLVTVGNDGKARIWNAGTGQLLFTLEHDGVVQQAVFSPDAVQLLTANRRTVRTWDARTGALVGPRLEHPRAVTSLAYSPDGARVLTACDDGAVRIWDAASGEEVAPPLVHRSPCDRAEFSPDGTRVVTSSTDGAVRIWDARSGMLLVPPLQHEMRSMAGAFSPDGTRVVTKDVDQDLSRSTAASIWDAASGKLLARFHQRDLHSVAFSSDGAELIAWIAGKGPPPVWDVSLDGGSLVEWKELLARCVPYELENGVLVPKPIGSALCRPRRRLTTKVTPASANR